MVLATHDDTAPYTSLMAFAATADLDRLVFVLEIGCGWGGFGRLGAA